MDQEFPEFDLDDIMLRIGLIAESAQGGSVSDYRAAVQKVAVQLKKAQAVIRIWKEMEACQNKTS